jgi:hypothetical protein
MFLVISCLELYGRQVSHLFAWQKEVTLSGRSLSLQEGQRVEVQKLGDGLATEAEIRVSADLHQPHERGHLYRHLKGDFRAPVLLLFHGPFCPVPVAQASLCLPFRLWRQTRRNQYL